MKKAGTIAMLAVTLAFAAFTAGFLIGRTTDRKPVSVNYSSSNTLSSVAVSTDAASSSHYTNTGLLNINTATAEELDALPGIGPTLAQRIVEYRERNGAFTAVTELSNVDGIGVKKVLAIMELITVEE